MVLPAIDLRLECILTYTQCSIFSTIGAVEIVAMMVVELAVAEMIAGAVEDLQYVYCLLVIIDRQMR